LTTGAFSVASGDDVEDLDLFFHSPGHISPPEKVAVEMRAGAKRQSIVEDVIGTDSSGSTTFNPLSRYPAFKDYEPARFSTIHVPDWELMHCSHLNDPKVCPSFLMKSIPPAEGLAKSIVPNVELVESTTHVGCLCCCP
jgi:hypothetical protein